MEEPTVSHRTEEPSTAETPPQRSSKLLRSGVVVSIAVFAANASNFIFQVGTGRLLDSSEYGLLLSAFTLLGLFSVATSAVQAAVAKTEAVQIVHGGDVVAEGSVVPRNLRTALRELADDRLAMLAIKAGLAGWVVTLALSPLIANFLHSDLRVALALSCSVPTLATTAVVFGRMQGRQLFQLFALLSLTSAAAKLGFGIGSLAIGFSTAAVLVVVAVTLLGLSAWGLILVRRPGQSGMRSLAGEVVTALIVLACWRAAIGMDIPLARYWLEEDTAGQFAAAAVIGRGILWLPEIVSFVLFPSLAAAVAEGNSSRSELRRSILMTVGMCLAGVAALRILGPWVFSLLYGEKYPDAADYAWKFALAAVPFSAANLFMFAALARRERRWIGWLISGVGLQALLMTLFHDSPNEMIIAAGVGGVLFLVVTYFASRATAMNTVLEANKNV